VDRQLAAHLGDGDLLGRPALHGADVAARAMVMASGRKPVPRDPVRFLKRLRVSRTRVALAGALALTPAAPS